ncbi:MAG: aminotransferase class V-fold PLP-dependent enzyme, partial [Pirellulales bacterium]
MSSSAQLAAGDFVRLAGEGALGLYGDLFLASGGDALPEAVRGRYPALAAWRGIAGLKASLRTIVGLDADSPIWFAQRSAVLMRRAARMLVERCERVLVTDTAWPPFLSILKRECRRAGHEIVSVRIRDDILSCRATPDEIVARLGEHYRHQRCDGLFLTAVSNEGIRLPTRRIAEHLSADRPVRFVVVDGAQEFCHAPLNLDGAWCGIYLTGCHKWLGAYQPMSIALAGRPTSA